MLSNDAIVHVSVTPTAGTLAPASFDTGLLLTESSDPVTEADRVKSYTSAAAMLEDGYTETDPAYLAAGRYFAQNPAPVRLLVARYPSSESITTGFDKALDITDAFYGVCPVNAAPGDIITLAGHMVTNGTRRMLFWAWTDTAEAALAPGSAFHLLKDAGYTHTIGILGAASDHPAAALMGAAMGLALKNRSGAFALCYKRLNAVTPSALSESQVTALEAVNANVFITRGASRALVEKGATASGLRYDEVLYMDAIAAELQEAAVAMLADNTGKLPQTDDTTAAFINRFTAILSGYASRDVLATALWRGADSGTFRYGDTVENGFALWANSFDTQSDADRAAHKAMPIHVLLCFAGSVETLQIDIDVTI